MSEETRFSYNIEVYDTSTGERVVSEEFHADSLDSIRQRISELFAEAEFGE